MLDTVLERFIEHSPVTVMARLALQRAIEPSWLDGLFEQHAERQYTRELLFSTTVELMSLVAVGLRPSVHAAAKAAKELPVSITALYDKINRTEPALVRALVAGSAQRLAPVMVPMRSRQPSSVAGWRLRIVDGNHLPASEKRIKPLRGFRGAALPGQSLVVYDPDSGLIVDLVPGEDAHAQERSLMAPILAAAQPGELWIADRNFSTRAILSGWQARGSAFIVREHGVSPNPTELGRTRRIARIDTGVVFEQPVAISDEDGGELVLRRIELQLDAPTADGDTAIRLLSNLPTDALAAQDIAQLYRRRWKIESMFQRLESVLQSEIAALGQPRAALLAFGVAALAYNVLAVLQATIRHQHALDAAAAEVSPYYLAAEIRAHYAGMQIAINAEAWAAYERLSAHQLGHALLGIAAHIEPRRFKKHPRALKPPTKKGYVAGCIARRHVATGRVLARGCVD